MLKLPENFSQSILYCKLCTTDIFFKWFLPMLYHSILMFLIYFNAIPRALFDSSPHVEEAIAPSPDHSFTNNSACIPFIYSSSTHSPPPPQPSPYPPRTPPTPPTKQAYPVGGDLPSSPKMNLNYPWCGREVRSDRVFLCRF
ncbi:hypothetical protein BDR04DRAFT_205688 [Suillus decipiens]|nr:hypothetical protein BDR04DRAFT_205688 [Suillus decipiens]